MTHAIERAKERYDGLELDRDSLHQISRIIADEKDPRAALVRDAFRTPTSREDLYLYAVFFRDRWLAVVTNRVGRIVTIDPPIVIERDLPWLNARVAPIRRPKPTAGRQKTG